MAPKNKKAAAAPRKQKSKTSEADEVSAAIIKHIDNLLTEDQDEDEVADYCRASCAAHTYVYKINADVFDRMDGVSQSV